MSYRKATAEELAAFVVPAPGGGSVSSIAPDEEVLMLDTGEAVAVSCRKHRFNETQGRVIAAVVRWLDADGGTRIDYSGNRVFVSFEHNACPGQMAAISEAAMTREVLMLVLGEPGGVDQAGEPLIAWPPALREGVSIRSAIASARNEGADFTIADLL